MEDWIEIISFTYPHEANLAKTFLEASGIKVILKDELTVQIHNLLSNAIGGVKLFVENSKTEEALSLLKESGYLGNEASKGKERTETFSIQHKTLCPYCKGADIVKKNMPGYIYALSILLLGFPLPFVKRTYHCYDCSKDWKVK